MTMFGWLLYCILRVSIMSYSAEQVTAVTEVKPEVTRPTGDEDTPEAVTANAIAEYVEAEEELLLNSDKSNITQEIANYNDSIVAANTIDFSDKTILCLGDSLTAGRGASLDEYGNGIGYANYIADYLDCDVLKYGVGGSTIGTYQGDSFCYRYEDMADEADIIIVFGGVNDFLTNKNFGDESLTEGTYTGDLNKLMNSLRDEYPDSDIFFVTIYRNQAEEALDVTPEHSLSDYMDWQKKLAGDYDIEVIDIYNTYYLDGHDQNNYSNYFFDTVHLNDDGYRILGKYLSAELIKYYAFN